MSLTVLLFYLIFSKLKSKYESDLDQKFAENRNRFYSILSKEFKKSLTLIYGTSVKLSTDDRLDKGTLEKVNEIKGMTLGLLDLTEQEIKGIETGAKDFDSKYQSIHRLEEKIQNIINQIEIIQEDSVLNSRLRTDNQRISPSDQKFLANVMNKIEEGLNQSDFSIDKIVTQLGYGRTVFYKKMKALTGNAPHDLVRIIKMKKASEMLINPGHTISGISYELGYNDPDYFRKIFKNYFGETPSEYQKKFR